MSKGTIIHLDNDSKGVLEPAKNLFDQNEFGLNYIVCQTKEEFDKALQTYGGEIKALIFDLLSKEPSEGELQEKDAEFVEKIRSGFAAYNIPIFIYSGYLQAVEGDFDDFGTVFKVDKGYSIQVIFDKFRFLFESGFIDVFCPGGTIELEIKEELNKSFTRQFSKNSEIEDVIKSIKDSENNLDKQVERVKKVFKRIAIKTLASDLLAPIADSEDKVHPIEHFYKRQSKLKVWTGDIWKNKYDKQRVIVLTPRCDLAIGRAANIILCAVEDAPKFDLNAKPEKLIQMLRKHLVDNIDGKAKRYIPSNIFMQESGMVNLAVHKTESLENFSNDYEYIVTLSDDLTNEIIGKFAYYFLRTGITNINEQEFEAIIKTMRSESDVKK